MRLNRKPLKDIQFLQQSSNSLLTVYLPSDILEFKDKSLKELSETWAGQFQFLEVSPEVIELWENTPKKELQELLSSKKIKLGTLLHAKNRADQEKSFSEFTPTTPKRNRTKKTPKQTKESVSIIDQYLSIPDPTEKLKFYNYNQEEILKALQN